MVFFLFDEFRLFHFISKKTILKEGHRKTHVFLDNEDFQNEKRRFLFSIEQTRPLFFFWFHSFSFISLGIRSD